MMIDNPLLKEEQYKMLYDPKWAPPETEIKIEPWQKILLDAANILEEKGWIQRERSRGTNYCMLGAIEVATYGRIRCFLRSWDDHDPVLREAVNHVQNSLDGLAPWIWNDAESRTKEQVIAKLREVANVV